MRADHGVPWFPLDALKMGLFLGASDLCVNPEDDDLVTADAMWPIIKGLLENLLFDGRDYLVEGVNLRPATVASFMRESEEAIRACFLGYPRLTAQAKTAFVVQYAGLPNDWLTRMGSDFMAPYLQKCVALSVRLENECSALGLPFIDTGVEFEVGLKQAERALLKG